MFDQTKSPTTKFKTPTTIPIRVREEQKEEDKLDIVTKNVLTEIPIEKKGDRLCFVPQSDISSATLHDYDLGPKFDLHDHPNHALLNTDDIAIFTDHDDLEYQVQLIAQDNRVEHDGDSSKFFEGRDFRPIANSMSGKLNPTFSTRLLNIC